MFGIPMDPKLTHPMKPDRWVRATLLAMTQNVDQPRTKRWMRPAVRSHLKMWMELDHIEVPLPLLKAQLDQFFDPETYPTY